MKNKILVSLFTVALLGAGLYQAGNIIWQMNCPGTLDIRQSLTEGFDVTCYALDSATPTPTAQSTTRVTPTRTLTPAPVSTSTPLPSPTQLTSLPLCETHDPQSWHALTSEAGDCHYNHTHKHNPNQAEVVNIFGLPGAWYGSAESIGYAWETLSENLHKHWVYTWITRLAIPRLVDNETGKLQANWLSDFRVQAHVDTSPILMPDGTYAGGYLGRQHSVMVEARGCSEAGCGLVRFGGWLNYGLLEIDEGNCVYLPSDDPTEPCG